MADGPDPTVVIISSAGTDEPVMCSLHYPAVHQLAYQSRALGCRATEPEFSLNAGGAGRVQAAGARLRQALDGHPAIRQRLSQILAEGSPGSWPIGVLPVGPGSDLPWETLWAEEHGFLALDERWPLVRVLNGGNPTTVPITTPVRIVAVIAALGQEQEGREELRVLRGALRSWDTDWSLTVFTSDRQLVDAPPDDERIEVRSVPDGSTALAKAVEGNNEAERPQIVHFFCHGRAGDVAGLEVATPLAAERYSQGREDYDSIILGAGDLDRLKGYTWLIVLNCCDGGRATTEGTSLAGQLIFKGVPAVLAHRRPAPVAVAHELTAWWYRRLLERVTQASLEPSASAQYLLSTLGGELWELRRQLCKEPARSVEEVAADRPGWTLPVLFLRNGGVRFIRGALPAGQAHDVAASHDAVAAIAASTAGAPAGFQAALAETTFALDASLREEAPVEVNDADVFYA